MKTDIKRKADVVVIGGGVTGCTIAYDLAKAGVDTVLLEKSYLGSGATGKSGGVVWDNQPTREFIKLAKRSLERFERLEDELDSDLETHVAGSVGLAYPGEEKAFKEGIELKRIHGVDIKWLEKDEMKGMFSEIDVDSGLIGGSWNPSVLHLNPFKAVETLADRAVRSGARICTFTEVRGIEVRDGEVKSILTSRGRVETGIAVNAAGAWSHLVSAMAGMETPNFPVKHCAWAHVTEPIEPFPENHPYTEFSSSRIWGHQTEHGGFVWGCGDYMTPVNPPRRECDYTRAELDHPRASLETLERDSRSLRECIPRFNSMNILRQWQGFFDASPDARPILGEVDRVRGLVMACGTSTTGFCLSQVTGELISDLIAKGKTPMQEIFEDLNLRRFQRERIVSS